MKYLIVNVCATPLCFFMWITDGLIGCRLNWLLSIGVFHQISSAEPAFNKEGIFLQIMDTNLCNPNNNLRAWNHHPCIVTENWVLNYIFSLLNLDLYHSTLYVIVDYLDLGPQYLMLPGNLWIVSRYGIICWFFYGFIIFL